MAEAPAQLDLARHRDLRGRRHEIWVRRALLLALAALPVLGLLNVFGQRPSSTTAHSPEASLSVLAPKRIRGGLLYEARFLIRAHRDLSDASLVLSPGWLEGMTINTIEPAASMEKSSNGSLSLSLGSIKAGRQWREYFEFQVNPTALGSRSNDVALYDGDTRVVSLKRTATVFP